MLKRICYFVVVSFFLFFVSGCTLLNTALSAGIAYGIYQATK